MAQTITASELIRRAMSLINAISAGETPADADLNDGLITLNELIDSLNLRPLTVYGEPNESVVLTPGVATYAWPGSGFLGTERPIWVNNVTCIRAGVSTPVEIVGQDEYDMIPLKSTPSPIIEKFLYVPDFPAGRVTLFPVPTEAVTLSINASRQIIGPIDLQTVIEMPPGYLRAYRYLLAMELWPEYTNASTDIASIRAIAKEALAAIKVANSEVSVARFDDVPGVEVGRGWDWRIG